MKVSFNKKKLQYGSASVLFIAFFVAIVVVLNIFASFLTERFSLKYDITAGGKYSLSAESIDILKKIENPVKIYILASRVEMEKDEEANYALETIMRYGTASGGKVTYEFVDPKKNPQFFNKYERAKEAEVFDIVVEGPERYIVVNTSHSAYRLAGNKSKTYYEGEEKITAAILYASSREVSAAGIVKGHNEEAPAALVEHFRGNHFDVKDVDLLKGIPEEVKNLIISAPLIDFTPEEIAELEKYLSADGNNLYVFWNTDVPQLPVIERYLSEWGISFDEGLICDEKNAYMSEYIVLSDLSESHVIDKDLQGELYLLAPTASPIVLGKPIDGTIHIAPLATTRDTSYAKIASADKTITTFSRELGDAPGPFVVAALAERTLGSMPDDGISRIAVFSSINMASEEICSVERAFNTDFFARLTEYTNPNTQTIKIAPKVDSTYSLNITEAEAKLFRALLIAILPLIIIVAAIFIFIKRKNK